MSDPTPHDPWSALADSLGAKPAGKPAPKPPAAAPVSPITPVMPVTPTAAQPVHQQPKPRTDASPVPAARSSWGELASSLGVAPPPPSAVAPAPASQHSTRQPEPSRPQPSIARVERPAAEPPARRAERRPEPRNDDRAAVAGSSEAIPSGGERTDSRPEGGGAGDDNRGEGRGRRRRGRRGGRGRGSRREDGPDRPLPTRLDDDQTAHWSGGSEEHDAFDEPPSDAARQETQPRDSNSGEPVRRLRTDARDHDTGRGDMHEDGEARPEPAGDGQPGSEDAPRRRRRRGRRGGRGRPRGGRDGEMGDQATVSRDGAEPSREAVGGTPRDERDGEDEPLPSGYRARPTARPTDSGRPPRTRQGNGRPASAAPTTGNGEPSAAAGNEQQGAGEPRRRRRRRRGEGRSSTSAADAPREGTAPRRSTEARTPRRGRRSTSEDRRSASTFERGRRDEFAPVAGGHDEDDEGLEFLGIEEAGYDAAPKSERTERHAEDDDGTSDGGIHTVVDVPSWVEAIGIVIAGNLDARSRSPRGSDGDRGRGGERRSDSSGRAGSDARPPRDSRRDGRPGDPQ